jgi:hypothetical protein
MWVKGCGALLLATALAAAAAQDRDQHAGGFDRGGAGFDRGGRAQHFDARYSHNHYYPDRGAMVRGLPTGAVAFNRPGGQFFYSGGVWYAPRGPNFVIVGAPFGVFVLHHAVDRRIPVLLRERHLLQLGCLAKRLRGRRSPERPGRHD